MSSRFCPDCNYQAENDELFCPRCGTKLKSDSHTALCNSCGAVLKHGAVFRSKCGTKREANSGKCVSLFSDSNEKSGCFDEVQRNESTNQSPEQKPKSSSSWMCENDNQSVDYQKGKLRHKRKSDNWIIIAAIIALILGKVIGLYFEKRAAEKANADRITLDTPYEDL